MVYISNENVFFLFKMSTEDTLWKKYCINCVQYGPGMIANTFGHNDVPVNAWRISQSEEICSPSLDFIAAQEWPQHSNCISLVSSSATSLLDLKMLTTYFKMFSLRRIGHWQEIQVDLMREMENPHAFLTLRHTPLFTFL